MLPPRHLHTALFPNGLCFYTQHIPCTRHLGFRRLGFKGTSYSLEDPLSDPFNDHPCEKDLTPRLRALFSDHNTRAKLPINRLSHACDIHGVNSNDDQVLSYRSPSSCSLPENVHPRLNIVVCEASDFLSCFACTHVFMCPCEQHPRCETTMTWVATCSFPQSACFRSPGHVYLQWVMSTI